MVAQDVYYDEIDGMIFGDQPDEGHIRGRRFAHPKLKFTFEVPSGFRPYNQSQAVIARVREGTEAIQFDRAPKPYGCLTTDHLTHFWGAPLRLTHLQDQKSALEQKSV